MPSNRRASYQDFQAAKPSHLQRLVSHLGKWAGHRSQRNLQTSKRPVSKVSYLLLKKRKLLP